MPDLELMCEALAFIESHLQQPITVANMADAVGYSLYHFCRIFNAATHHTPYEYLMRRRLSKSVEALATSEAKIIDIAFDFQFNSHETYSRAFKRLLGVQPNQVRKGEWIDPHRLMPPLTRAHLEHLRNRAHLKPRLVNLESITIAGVMA
ncbi:MAG: helix-turn-helix transcriptional regulator, partial [Anaerolineae bacterium]|nr:helix-turn-helix transcriptional regulator [Anaerolineae bacterium]